MSQLEQAAAMAQQYQQQTQTNNETKDDTVYDADFTDVN